MQGVLMLQNFLKISITKLVKFMTENQQTTLIILINYAVLTCKFCWTWLGTLSIIDDELPTYSFNRNSVQMKKKKHTTPPGQSTNLIEKSSNHMENLNL